MQNTFYTNTTDEYYNIEKKGFIDLIPEGPNKILDLGCATGQLGRKLIQLHKAAELVGVEIYAPVAQEATKYYNTIYQGDIENLILNYENYFDFVICGDILEHLRDPWRIIQKIKLWLKDNGLLISCVPNLRHWRIMRDLLIHGKWNYAEAGILDITHLRFFTRQSFFDMLNNANYQIIHYKLCVHGKKQGIFNHLTLKRFEEFLASQIMVIARVKNN